MDEEPTTITLQPMPVVTDQGASDGRLVLTEQGLIAVLLRLSEGGRDRPSAGPDGGGGWCLEAGFGPCAGVEKTFSSLEEAHGWIAGRLATAPHLPSASR